MQALNKKINHNKICVKYLYKTSISKCKSADMVQPKAAYIWLKKLI